MAYPTGTLGIVLSRIDQQIAGIKQFCIRNRDAAAAGPITATTIIDIYLNLKRNRTELIQARSVPGLAEYARAEKGDATLDVVAEFNAVIAAIDSATTWIQANFPKDENGYILAQTWGTDSLIDRNFTTSQTTGLRNALQPIILQIN
jgi:hypothetical protein